MNKMQMKAVSLACLMVAAGSGTAAWAGTFQQTQAGVTVSPDAGAAKEIRLQVMADNIVHVVKVDQAGKELTPSLMTVAKPCACTFDVKKSGDSVSLATKKIVATVSLKDGRVRFADKGGAVFLKQDAEDLKPVTVGGKPYLAVKQGFNFGTKDAFYGTGQHQNNQMNLNGEDVDLLQHNMDIAIPLVVSDKNYGILWDNNGITRFGDARPYGPIGRDLKLTDAAGKDGALTARYYIGGKLALERREDNINYQYLKDVAEFWPKELKPLKELKDVKVVW
jgi:alpha-D-xyloside xylohydrolase